MPLGANHWSTGTQRDFAGHGLVGRSLDVLGGEDDLGTGDAIPDLVHGEQSVLDLGAHIITDVAVATRNDDIHGILLGGVVPELPGE